MSWTPGPWKQCNLAIYAESDGETIANCTQKEIRRAFADARLIAAAPDLLAACKSALADLDRWQIYGPCRTQLIAALKKAEGE